MHTPRSMKRRKIELLGDADVEVQTMNIDHWLPFGNGNKRRSKSVSCDTNIAKEAVLSMLEDNRNGVKAEVLEYE